jgi:hypothetical protein
MIDATVSVLKYARVTRSAKKSVGFVTREDKGKWTAGAKGKR